MTLRSILSLSAPATAIICGVVGAGCLSLCVTSWVRVHGALFGFGGWIVVVLVLLEDFFEILAYRRASRIAIPVGQIIRSKVGQGSCSSRQN